MQNSVWEARWLIGPVFGLAAVITFAGLAAG